MCEFVRQRLIYAHAILPTVKKTYKNTKVMDKLIQIFRKIAAFPIIGNLLLIVISVFPLLLGLATKLSYGLPFIIGGLGMAALCYFLKAKNVINILAPGGIPMWIVGLLITAIGVYVGISDVIKGDNAATQVSMQETIAYVRLV